MSGIYVKGVVLPKEGLTEILIRSDGTALVACGPVYEDATAIQVPDHGDLIDRGKLPTYTGYALSAAEVAKAVDDAPAVIPAERGREDE